MSKEKVCFGCFEKYQAEYMVCPHCGYVEGTPVEEPLHMEPGTLLKKRYIIGRVLGFGGFGVTYIAWDTVLQIKVAIKEYLPSEFSTRIVGRTEISVYNGNKSVQFKQGMTQFVDEAKKLAQFNNESGIVKVYDSFLENNTAYIIMEYLEGETLSARVESRGSIPADELIKLLVPVMESLETIHKSGIIHRDISPDNIMLLKDGTAKLIDFGAARHATTSHSRSMTVIIKAGYSPEEQYRSGGEQGAHTDVYAIGATMYKAVTGVTPPDALERFAVKENKKREILKDLSLFDTDLTEGQEIAIMNALNVRIESRTPDMRQFIDELTSDKKPVRRYDKIKGIDFLRWPLWAKIAVPAAAVCAVGFGVISALTNVSFDRAEIPDDMVRVPAVINTRLENCINSLASKILLPRVVGAQPSTIVAENIVMDQNQDIGSYVLENTIIRMEVSTGIENNIVPDVVGMYLEQAQQRLEDVGYVTAVSEEYSAVIAEGAVIEQSVAAGQEYDLEAIVTLTVSKGEEPDSLSEEKIVKMPDMNGKTLEEALSIAEESGMMLAVSSREYSSSVRENCVMYQSIEAGQEVMSRNTVELMVSLGEQSIRAENVFCKTEAEAIDILRQQGLNVSEILYAESNLYEKGLVIAQSPESGTEMKLDSEVTITVSAGAEAFEMPDVSGNKLDEVRDTLREYGLVVIVSYANDDSAAPDTILSQDITAGTEARPGDTIVLTVNSETDEEIVSVPDVTGMELEKAGSLLVKSDLQVAVNEVFSNDVKEGYVISQTPPAGMKLTKNSVLTLTVSLGKAMVTAPELTGKTLLMAEAMLEDAGLEVKVTEEYSDTIAEGMVIYQTPEAKSGIYSGDTVEIVVSKGKIPVVVPDVTGVKEQDAVSLLTENGLVYNIKTAYSDTVKEGCVISQNPESGESRVKGDNVVITVSLGKSDVMPEKISVNRTSASLSVGDTIQLVTEITPEDASDKTVSWSSSNASVASVSENGLVHATGSGTATITVRTNSGDCTASCRVTVKKAEVSSIQISSYPTKLSYYSGESLNTVGLRLMVVYDNGKTEIISSGFSTSCSMEGTGEKTVRITYEGKTTSYKIRITGVELSMSTSSLSLKTGETYRLTASSTVSGTVKWSSSDSGVASVSDGVVSANKEGSAVITAAMTYNGTTYRASCNVTVSDNITPSLDITSGSVTLYGGETFSIAADVVPAGQKISWSTSNAVCASVSSSGIITANSTGSAVVTASMTYNGKTYTDTCNVTVVSPSIQISPSSVKLYPGNTRQLSVSVVPDNASVLWSSSNALVVSVSDGMLVANSAGTATVTAEIRAGGASYKSSCTVTVQEPMVQISSSSISLCEGESAVLSATAAPAGTEVSWSSSNALVVSVANGTVVANSAGTATVTAQIMVNGMRYTSTCTVTVYSPSVQISQSSLNLTSGSTGSLSAVTVPSSASVMWSSSDASCIVVDSSGGYMATYPGTATITASITVNGVRYNSYCTVTVTE